MVTMRINAFNRIIIFSMERKVHLTFEFFKVTQPKDSSLNFEDTLVRLLNKDITQKDKKILANENNSEEIVIVFTKVRMNNIPDKINVNTGSCSPIELRDDEGLSEKVVFIFNKKLKIVAIQKNVNSITSTGIFNFIRTEIDDSEFETSFIIRQDVLDQLYKMKLVNKCEIKIDCTKDLSCLKDSSNTIFDRIAKQKNIDANLLNITFSMGLNSKDSISDSLISILKKLSLSNNDAIRSLNIWGKDEENKSTVLDLLNFKLVDKQEVKVIKRNIDNSLLISSAKNAINNKLDILKGYL